MTHNEAIGQIDIGYFLLREKCKEVEDRKPIMELTRHVTQSDEQLFKYMIPILEDIIRAKKFLEKDYSKEEIMMKKLERYFE